jgi:hypothetical protein
VSGFSWARQDAYSCLLFKRSTMSQAVEAPHAAANVPIKAQLPLRPNASNVALDEIKSEQCAACTDSRPSLQAP